MSRKEKYEIPEPEIKAHGDLCGSDGLPCLHEGEARKQAKKTPSFQGNIHQALPHRSCGWWHVYVIAPKRRSVQQRKSDAREDRRIREMLEGSDG